MDEKQDFAANSPESKAAYVLSNVVEVVELILTFVPTKSLLRIASVCRLWRNCARRVVRTQQTLTWVSACGPSDCQVHALCPALQEEVEKVFVLPKTVFAMVDCDAFTGQDHYYRQNKVTPSGSGVQHPKEYQSGEAGFAVLLPSIEGVNIKPFHFCKKSMSPTALKEAGLVDNPDLRVVMLFVYEAHISGGARFVNQILDPLAKSKALITGGLVETVFSPTRQCCRQGEFGVMGLALSGPKVQGASVLLDQDVVCPKTAEATIRRLKAAKIPERNTVGLMFACLGRGQNYYHDQANVEADAFHKVFPNIPVFGFFGNGEIGCDRIVRDDYTLCETDTESLQHEYTTVMTLVHLG
ncbi:F-box only protein 22 [Synchiropus splendidus]|uniref:F-box only protein 22 n=1 Tax=Synchiropus splendidus TaxID=270530 RepID=UPI00237E3E19|nr:F-box only protein 22 [Synchiropus splendidus]